MKRCTETHTVAGFGEIPAGSLWEDDSPFVLDDHADKFEPVDADPAPPAVKPKPRKFGQKATTTEGEATE